MPELRLDPIQRRWVIISSERGRRPEDFFVDSAMPSDGFCPFCEGHEKKTPPEIYASRTGASTPNAPGWQIRVVPNKFPALKIEGDVNRHAHGLYDAMNGVGAHEVIIDTPQHDLHFGDIPLEQMELLLRTYRDRMRDLFNDSRLKYVLIFKNHGLAAGASLAHPHTQIIATPVTPKTVALELESALEHFSVKERCLFCDIIQAELAEGTRVVTTNSQFVVLAPYASRFPFEIFLAPRQHRHDFAAITDEEVSSLAEIFRDTMQRMKVALKDPPYNFVIHTIPNRRSTKRATFWQTLEYDFHWHIEILPRLTRIAGFEWGSGFYLNPTAPEEAAQFFRELQL
ncbi:MAG: galactose-1-phosphate uridylyltransferase [Acidobacteria bacterium]|nr:galactose-1-phosphate uridylyltransferase [Acidobacteriota bacterium]